MKEELSPSGHPIYRYDGAQNAPNKVTGNEETIEQITTHIEQTIGPIAGVLHEIISDQVHLDIHIVYPNEERPFYTLITSGMSDQPMQVPKGVDSPQFMELCILLPEDWPMPEQWSQEDMQKVFAEEEVYWPIRWLKMVARLPHQYNSWIGWGHTIPNGEFADPFAENTELGCMLVLPTVGLPEDFGVLKTTQREIHFFSLTPIYKEEMEYKLNHGTEALIEKFVQKEIPIELAIKRVNVATHSNHQPD